MAQEGVTKVTSEQRPEGGEGEQCGTGGKSTPDTGNRTCEDPGMGAQLECLRIHSWPPRIVKSKGESNRQCDQWHQGTSVYGTYTHGKDFCFILSEIIQEDFG